MQAWHVLKLQRDHCTIDVAASAAFLVTWNERQK